MNLRAGLVPGFVALVLMGCEQFPDVAATPEAETAPAAETPAEPVPAPQVTVQDELAATLPLPGEQPSLPLVTNIPHVYMSLQPDEGSGPISIVFAIDRSRDNSPENDPAIRLTPEDGKCNPQEMRRFEFPDTTRQRPIFGPIEAQRGITAKELPNFMAMMVTGEMMRQGLIVQPEESKPQNVCTRKLWERMVVQQSNGQG